MTQLRRTKPKTLKEFNKNQKPIIVLMTRWHSIYRCKSRLSNEIGALQAAKIQQKLTNHTIKVALEIQKESLADVKIAIDGIGIQAAKNGHSEIKSKRLRLKGLEILGQK